MIEINLFPGGSRLTGTKADGPFIINNNNIIRFLRRARFAKNPRLMTFVCNLQTYELALSGGVILDHPALAAQCWPHRIMEIITIGGKQQNDFTGGLVEIVPNDSGVRIKITAGISVHFDRWARAESGDNPYMRARRQLIAEHIVKLLAAAHIDGAKIRESANPGEAFLEILIDFL